MDGDVSSTDTDEGPPPTDLYCTEDEDALHRLYVRTRRRRRRRRRKRRTTWWRPRVQLVPSTEAGGGFGAVPASGVAIAYLPETTVGAGEARESGAQCAVCLDEYEAGDALRTMPCSHGFHERCIVEWLRASRLCPLCRFPLPAEDTETYDEGGREADDYDDEEDTETGDEDDEREAGHDDDDGERN